ncbi:MAG: universal stress protein [Candidatus Hodarchaeota archaeon]
MFKRILVPLDGSRLSTKALPYAGEIAKRFNAEVVLLQVLEPTRPSVFIDADGYGSAEATEAAIQAAELRDRKKAVNARRYLRRQVKKITDMSIKVSYNIMIGTAGESIVRFCRKEKIDLVVMTTHGRSGFKRAILGSVADEIVREPGVHVLVIRPKK